MSILNPVYEVVAWVITQIYNLVSPVFGKASGVTWVLTIVLLVVLMRLIMVPLFIKQMHTQRAMTALGPRMAELRKKHKGDRETLNAETMKLYQEAGVNPLMGCLPVVLQLPLFFALFEVLKAIADWTTGHVPPYSLPVTMVASAKHAEIFGATIADKVLFTGNPAHGGIAVPLHAKVVIIVAVLISMTTTFLTVRQSQKRGMMPSSSDNSAMGQSQKMMAYVMPLFALTGLYWQFGLVLYWVTTNLWTLGQQYVLLRRYPVGAAASAPGGNLPISGTGKPGRGLFGGASSAALNGKSGGAAGRPAPGGKSGAGAARPAGPAADGAAEETGGTSAKGVAPGGAAKAGGEPGRAAPQKPGGGAGAAKPKTGSGPGPGGSNGHRPAAAQGAEKPRLFGRARAQAEPAQVEREVKIVRQQRAKQSRSKRSRKR